MEWSYFEIHFGRKSQCDEFNGIIFSKNYYANKLIYLHFIHPRLVSEFMTFCLPGTMFIEMA